MELDEFDEIGCGHGLKAQEPLAADFGHGVLIAPFETKSIVDQVKVGLRRGVHELS